MFEVFVQIYIALCKKTVSFQKQMAIWFNSIPYLYPNDLKTKYFNPTVVHTQKSSHGKKIISSNLIQFEGILVGFHHLHSPIFHDMINGALN